jgi:6,7-dimethyl-8-ribityllumazine synthase
MPPIIEGHLIATGFKIALVASRFNGVVTDRLVAGALDALIRHGADEKNVDLVRVPGSFELHQAAAKLAAKGRYDAVVALGCLIRGETPHFDLLAAEAVKGLAQVAVTSGVPVIFGVLTCDTLEQAIDRAGLKGGNKGFEAGLGAVEMAQLMNKLRTPSKSSAPKKRRGK